MTTVDELMTAIEAFADAKVAQRAGYFMIDRVSASADVTRTRTDLADAIHNFQVDTLRRAGVKVK